MENSNNVVQLTLPSKAEYVSTARLVGSSIATRAGFDIDIVEDIKVAISEVCNNYVKKIETNDCSYTIIFTIHDNKLTIDYKCPCFIGKLFEEDEEDFAKSIMTALMDEVEFNPDSETMVSMCKFIEENSGDGQK